MSLNKAQIELERFLLDHPHLVLFQRRLEKEMNSAPEEQRILVIVRYLNDNLDQLRNELMLLDVMLSKQIKRQ